MLGKNGTYVLVFFLLLWSGFIGYFVYQQNQPQTTHQANAEADYSTRPYSDEELIQMAGLEENTIIVEDTSIQQDFSLGENVVVIPEEVVVDNILDDTQNPYADVVAIIESQQLQNSPTNNDEPAVNEGEVFIEPTIESYEETPQPDSETEPVVEYVEQVNSIVTKPEPTWYSAEGFVNLYNVFEKTNTHLSFLNKYIYNIPDVDDYIKTKAQQRGYQQRGFADEQDLVWFESVRTRPEVRDAYIALRNEMLKQDIRLHFVSGYRTSTHQRDIFTRKMSMADPTQIPTGIHDSHLNTVLSRSAIPGYSKHHSGYAADFGCGNDYLVFAFAETPCHDWLSADNFANARKHGFIPSYPDGAENQGPDPEPWEYVWVGVEAAQ